VTRVLITGNGGFVGRVLVEKMAVRGYEVWGADRAPMESGFKGARQLSVDLTNQSGVVKVLDQAQPEAIVHLAAQASVRRSFDEPIETILNNTLPVLYMLDHLRAHKTACRLLVVGSADEYGPVDSPDELPLREDSPVRPTNPYALAKSIQNQYGTGYALLYGTDVVATRSFNHTGAGQRDAFVLPSFAKQITEIKLGRRDPVIHAGNLDVRRDFVDVRDVCEAYIALLEKGKKGETYNVCSGRSYRLRDLLDRLCELAGVDVRIEVDADRLRPVDTPELRGDNAKIRAHTGWSPQTPIEETLGSLLDYWARALAVEENTKAP
jgi:GDP-4-dehydro-6-deoxy-D-mannose reductase